MAAPILQSRSALGQALIETDRRYFELGANHRRLTGAELVWIDALVDLAAAGVAHRVNPDEVSDPAAWVAELTAAQLDLGFAAGRVYFDEPCAYLEARLAADGWTMRREPVLIASERVPERDGDAVVLHPVRSEDDWLVKAAVHRADERGPDGHGAPAEQWVAMERARVASGELDAWLVLRGETVCGTVCTMTGRGVLRNKNLLVHPDHRRTGVGMGTLGRLDAMARSQGLVLGTFSISGEAGDLLYRAAGMRTVAERREWTRNWRWE